MNRIKYLKELALILLLFFGGFFGVTLLANWVTARHEYKINEVESNLYFIDEDEQFDMVITGISHARNFSRQTNHATTESILNKKVLNLGRGGGLCGLHGQQLYLDFFFEKGNTTEEVLFIATPPLLYGTYLDRNEAGYWDEAIRIDFSWFILKNGNSDKRWQLYQSFIRKAKPSWLSFKKYSNEPNTNQLEKIDSIKIEEGMKLAYPEGMTPEMLDENLFYFKKIVKTCQQNNANLKVIIPPAVFGKWQGHESVLKELEQLRKVDNFEIIDFSEAILEKEYYYDHHHLNSSGVKLFWGKYISKD